MNSVQVSQTIKIYGFRAGSVSVHPAHRLYRGPTFLRFPTILLERAWTEPLPIWVWLIETEAGRFLVDTGENVSVYDEDYFGEDKVSAFINRRILRLDITQAEQIDQQLQTINLTHADIDAVVLTHLHLDHTDGLRFFPKADILVSATEWRKPFGAAKTTFPAGLQPKLIDYNRDDSPFGYAYRLTNELTLVPTPGHTFGHQSVLVDAGAYRILLAGDTSFTEQQLLLNQKAGIILDWNQAGQTYDAIRAYARDKPLIYLPSHDPESGNRLANKRFVSF